MSSEDQEILKDAGIIGDTLECEVWGTKLLYFISLDKSDSPTAIGISVLTPDQVEKVRRLGSKPSGEVKPVMIPLKDWPRVVKIVNDLRLKLGE